MRHATIGLITAVGFSSDGKTLLTSNMWTARLWDAATGAPRGRGFRHQGFVHAVALSRDVGTLLTGGPEGAWLWHVPQCINDPERIRLWIEVTTGRDTTDETTARRLSLSDWLLRRQGLEELGGPPLW
jgi:hypothetical protein